MYGIKDPVIIERSWRAVREITAEQLSKDIAYAEDINFHVHEVHFEDPAGKPVVVVWVAGRRAGNLLSEYCITERPMWAYAHTGWSAHSSYVGQRSYWLARYESGKQVDFYQNSKGLPIRFKSHESATRKAAELNKADGIAA